MLFFKLVIGEFGNFRLIFFPLFFATRLRLSSSLKWLQDECFERNKKSPCDIARPEFGAVNSSTPYGHYTGTYNRNGEVGFYGFVLAHKYDGHGEVALIDGANRSV